MSQYVTSHIIGFVQNINVAIGDQLKKGDTILQIESMKMITAIKAEEDLIVDQILVLENEMIEKGSQLISYSTANVDTSDSTGQPVSIEVDHEDSHTALRDRKKLLYDEHRLAAVEKRAKKGRNTARKNVELLIDEDSFVEYGGLIIAAQRTRRSKEDLMKNTPADGLIGGIGRINSQLFDSNVHCLVMAYDFTVLAGTQGHMNHFKMDRLLDIAKDRSLPVVLFAEGGGGRPGDVDVPTIAGLYLSTFSAFAGLTNQVPTISIVEGYCFAGNAALAGSSDLIIATEQASIGMGGPAMISGGGLGDYHPSEVGPAAIQSANGVIDILVKDENEAIITTQQIIGMTQGNHAEWSMHDQDLLQDVIPQNRKYVFDMHTLLALIVDKDTIIEIKRDYGQSIITAFARINGMAIGIVANDNQHTAGAITASAANKMAGFVRLCSKYQLPIISFIDTPGIMVGPKAEKEGTVKAAGQLFVAAAAYEGMFLSVVVRRSYGLGAMAMMGGSSQTSMYTVSWPSGAYGAMGIEGAVRLGFKKELEAIQDVQLREQKFLELVDQFYRQGSAINVASMMEIDDVIEPRETRKWIVNLLGMI